MRQTIGFVFALVALSLSPAVRFALHGLIDLYIDKIGPLPDYTKTVIDFPDKLVTKFVEWIIKEHPPIGEYLNRKFDNIHAYAITIVNDRDDGLSWLEIFSKIYNGKLRPTANIPKEFTDFLSKLKTIFNEESPEFGKSIYKKTEDFFADYVTIVRNADGLTELEITDKIYGELHPQFKTSITADFLRLPDRIQTKVIRAFQDMETEVFGIPKPFNGGQKGILKKKPHSVEL